MITYTQGTVLANSRVSDNKFDSLTMEIIATDSEDGSEEKLSFTLAISPIAALTQTILNDAEVQILASVCNQGSTDQDRAMTVEECLEARFTRKNAAATVAQRTSDVDYAGLPA